MHVFTQDWFKVNKIYVTACDPSICVCVWGGGVSNADCISDFVLNILYTMFYISLRSVTYQPYIYLSQQVGLIVEQLYLGVCQK
jgi:hypoxanthine phosphoribosyltransferase